MRVYVVDVEGEIAGFVAVLPKGFAEEPLLEYICIEENYRDQGLGTRLLTFFEQRLFPSADNYYLLVSDINHKAKALYESLGYVQVGALSNYNLVDQTEYVMRKTVRPRQEKMANGSK